MNLYQVIGELYVAGLLKDQALAAQGAEIQRLEEEAAKAGLRDAGKGKEESDDSSDDAEPAGG